MVDADLLRRVDDAGCDGLAMPHSHPRPAAPAPLVSHRVKLKVPLGGFAAENIAKAGFVRVWAAGFVSSHEPQFHHLIRQVWRLFLTNEHVPEHVSQLLVVIRNGVDADVHVDRFDVALEVKAKRGMTAGENVPVSKVAEVRAAAVMGIDFAPTDSFVLVFRVGWAFGLAFRFVGAGQPALSAHQVTLWLGQCYRQMLFWHELRVLGQSEPAARLREDGWFPFLELLGGDFEELGRMYSTGGPVSGQVDEWTSRFDGARLDDIVGRWWAVPAFERKRALLGAGVALFVRGDVDSTVGAIKILATEIEGLLNAHFSPRKKLGQKELIARVEKAVAAEFAIPGSIGFPREFVEYLRDVVFASFDLTVGVVPPGRHAWAHGAAAMESYGRARALQLILTLDQLHVALHPREEHAAASGGEVRQQTE